MLYDNMTVAEMRDWLLWMQGRWNRPDKADWNTARICYMLDMLMYTVVRINVTKPELIPPYDKKLEDFLPKYVRVEDSETKQVAVKFITRGDEKKLKEEASKASLAAHADVFGFEIGPDGNPIPGPFLVIAPAPKK